MLSRILLAVVRLVSWLLIRTPIAAPVLVDWLRNRRDTRQAKAERRRRDQRQAQAPSGGYFRLSAVRRLTTARPLVYDESGVMVKFGGNAQSLTDFTSADAQKLAEVSSEAQRLEPLDPRD